jgi:hypothetical protein
MRSLTRHDDPAESGQKSRGHDAKLAFLVLANKVVKTPCHDLGGEYFIHDCDTGAFCGSCSRLQIDRSKS